MFSSFRNYLITFIISLVIFGLIGYFAVSFGLRSFVPDTISGNNGYIETGVDPSAETTSSAEKPDFSAINGESFTMILIGTDYRPAVMKDYDITSFTDGFPDPKRTIQADTIIIVRLDKEKGECMISAIPSNMSVMVDGVNTQLRELYSEKNLQFLIDKVSSVTGLKFDYYACIHIQDFINIIDKLGGFTFDVPVDMNYTDHKEGLTISIRKGTQWLDGATVAKMLRYRGYSDGNISRMNLAVNFLKSVLNYLTEPQFMSRAPELYKGVIDYTKTNLWVENLTAQLDLIYALPNFTYVDITYPGTTKVSGDVEYFEPQISAAIDTYFEYRKQY